MRLVEISFLQMEVLTMAERLTYAEKLASATNEDKQVNELYKHELKKQFSKLKDENGEQLLLIDIDNPIYFATDGIFSCSYLGEHIGTNTYLPFYMLMECKLEKDFNNIQQKAEVLVQVVAYLAQLYFANFVNNPSRRQLARGKFKFNEDILEKIDIMPSTVFVGSKQTCFAVDTEQLKKYYTRDINFDSLKSASTFRTKPEGEIIYEQLLEDSMLDSTSPVFNTSNKYCIADIADIIYRYNKNIRDADDLSPKNLYRAFTRFTTRVLTPETVEKLSNRQQASLLAQFIVNRKAIKQETNLDGELEGLSVNGLRIQVNTKEWNTFSWIYNLKQYNDDEQKKITAITDQLISEDDRRRKGDFYTPSIWVEEAHKLLDKNLEENWRDNYMVWDCAWGTGNLTRDCTKLNGTYIKDLYCSTLHETDLEIGARYNTNATKFQYDFLNDDVEEFENISNLCKIGRADTANAILFNTKLYKSAPTLVNGILGIDFKKYMEQGIREELPRKKLLFLINPPYKKSGAITKKGGDTGKEVAKTKLSDLYKKASGSQLYAQFLYRIVKIAEIFKIDTSVGIFSDSGLFSVDEHKELLKYAHSNGISYKDGFLMQASNFADVSDNWGISFAFFCNCGQLGEYNFRVMEITNDEVSSNHNKRIYTLDKSMQANNWCKKKVNYNESCVPYLSDALGTEDRSIKSNKNGCDNFIGGFWTHSNRVLDNNQRVSLWSTIPNQASGNAISVDSFFDMIGLFAARRLITGAYNNWENCGDQYMIPNENDPKYESWKSDCIIYSLFNSKSIQTSLRNVVCQGNCTDIQNEFFWMSVKDVSELATGKISKDTFNEAVCDDIEKYGDNRFVYKKLQEVTLSEDAQAVLNKATEIVKKSFKYRRDFNQKHPEYQINTWDAGWYQIKGMCKEYTELKKELEEFNALYKALEDRMRPLVYELGFLYE